MTACYLLRVAHGCLKARVSEPQERSGVLEVAAALRFALYDHLHWPEEQGNGAGSARVGSARRIWRQAAPFAARLFNQFSQLRT